MFLGLPDPDLLVRGMDLDPDPSIIFLSSSKNSKQTLDSYCFVTSFGLLILKNDVNVPSKSKKQKNFFLNLFFVSVLKVNDENSRIQIRFWILIH
jgi:hypothetical protein